MNLSWKTFIETESQKEYFKNINKIIQEEYSNWIIYPEKENIFACFDKTPFKKVKVVILWQDPYHWPNQANWLSFSVQKWQKLPPSLRNIYKELKNDLDIDLEDNWDLSHWAEAWVLLLNSVLTVKQKSPWSHKNIWWEIFSDNAIKYLNDNSENIVFILWWNFAINKETLIDQNKHFIIKSPHPSPFSAYRWFFWSKCFSKCNQLLESKNITTINWKRPKL